MKRWALSLVLAPLFLMGSSTATLADDPGGQIAVDIPNDPEPTNVPKLLSEDEAFLQDATKISSTTGQPVGKVLEALQFQMDVQELIGSLPADVLTSSYAGGAIASTPTPGATLYFKGAVPAAARTRRDRAGLGAVDLQGGMTYTLDELTARQNAVHDAAVAQGFTEVTSAVDVGTQAITVDVGLQPARPDLRGEVLRSRIEESAQQKGVALADPDLVVVEHPAGEALSGLDHGYGGAWYRDDGVRECTSAFTIRRRSDGAEGLLTAAHCEGLNQLEENNSSGGANVVFSAPFVSEHIGTYGDLEWHTTTHDDYPQFWSSFTTRRPVSSRIANSQITRSSYVCHFGRVSGYSCGTVVAVNMSKTFFWSYCGCSVTARNLVHTQGALRAGGDSGGPWFLGNQAWGVHQGWTDYDDSIREVFSTIQNAETAFGANVQLG